MAYFFDCGHETTVRRQEQCPGQRRSANWRTQQPGWQAEARLQAGSICTCTIQNELIQSYGASRRIGARPRGKLTPTGGLETGKA
eukprot:7896062-Pyramimonas_sp.AAC.1